MRPFLIPVLSMILAGSCLAVTDSEAFHALVDAEWEYTMQEAPTWASMLGDRRWNDRWGDSSPTANARRAEHSRELLAKLSKVDRSALKAADQLSLDLLKYETQLAIDEYANRLWTLPLNQ